MGPNDRQYPQSPFLPTLSRVRNSFVRVTKVGELHGRRSRDMKWGEVKS